MSRRIMHIADIHLSVRAAGQSGGADPRNDPAAISAARCWTWACTRAAERDVDAVIVAGDLFHRRDPDRFAIGHAAAGLRILQEAGIPTLILVGNHDGDGLAQPGASIAEVLALAPNVTAVTLPGLVTLPNGIIVGCLPWVAKDHLVTSKGLRIEETRYAIEDALAGTLKWLRAEAALAGGADILCAHWSIEGSVFSSERDVTIGNDPIIPRAHLEGWTYAALGHIHRQQEWRVGPTVAAYAGALDRTSFGEQDEPKGFLEYDLDTDELTFHESPARRYVTIDASEGDPTVDVDVAGAVVRVRDVAPEQVPEWRRVLAGRGATQVVPKLAVKRQVSVRASTVTDKHTPLDVFEQWMADQQITPERMSGVRDVAKRLLEEAS